jgi:Tol biopolymer transport system component
VITVGNPVQSSPDRKLDSWKEIAEHLGREVRTVQRWEQEQGLPVHRHVHKKRSSVYAFASEIDEWWRTRAPVLGNGREGREHKNEGVPLELVDSKPRRPAKWAIIAVSVCILILAAISAAYWSLWRDTGAFQNVTIEPLLTVGNTPAASISPDGKFLAYTVSESGKESVWLRHIASGSALQIVPPADISIESLYFSADGSFIDFRGSQGPHRVPLLGGAAMRKAPVGPQVSPDGKRVAFVRPYRNGQTDLIVANIDGTGERKLATREDPEFLQTPEPWWSPDGKLIACVAGTRLPASRQAVLVVSADGKSRQILGRRKFYAVLSVTWLSNRGLAMIVRDEPSGVGLPPNQIWYIPYPHGEARRITRDMEDYDKLSSTADARNIVAVRSRQHANMWIADAVGQARQITSGDLNVSRGQFTWTTDGRVLYTARTTRLQNLWIGRPDGSEAKQITSSGGWWPNACQSGRFVVYEAGMPPEPTHIWRAALDGSEAKQVSNVPGRTPFCSPDGKWAFFVSVQNGRDFIMKAPIDGGDAIQVTSEMTGSPSVSPDGKSLAATSWYRRPFTEDQPGVGIYPASGGPRQKFIALDNYSTYCGVRWTPDGKSILYVATKSGVSNVWSQPVEGGPPKQWTDFKTDQIWGFALSSDGTQIALSRGKVDRSVVLIRDQR